MALYHLGLICPAWLPADLGGPHVPPQRGEDGARQPVSGKHHPEQERCLEDHGLRLQHLLHQPLGCRGSPPPPPPLSLANRVHTDGFGESESDSETALLPSFLASKGTFFRAIGAQHRTLNSNKIEDILKKMLKNLQKIYIKIKQEAIERCN